MGNVFEFMMRGFLLWVLLFVVQQLRTSAKIVKINRISVLPLSINDNSFGTDEAISGPCHILVKYTFDYCGLWVEEGFEIDIFFY